MKNSKIIHPKLSLVGAGPGDPELLTLKAVKAIEQADVILYDALVNPQILEYAPNAYKLFVGKRKGCHAYAQDQINELIVKYAREYGQVVRLKGGDPFVFGRGSEEKEYAESHGIPTTVIPGISSAIAAPASAGIPVTQRHVSESFWVITGTTSGHQVSKDIEIAAKTSATVVILMGVNKLSEIVDIYKQAGKDELPIAIIQNGTCENEHVETGSISSIEKIAAESKISSPAIIIVGEVVKACDNYREQLFTAGVDEFILQNLGISVST